MPDRFYLSVQTVLTGCGVQIQLVYQTWDGGAPVTKFLLPEEYFDPLEPGESYEVDGVPKYNHTWQYLDVPPRRLKWTVERRSGTADDTTIRAQYMDGGQSWMTHRSDPDGYEEMIHSTQIGDGRCHILRTCRTTGGGWVVHLNTVIEGGDDGTQREKRLDGPWSFDEAMDYGRFGNS
ncbi:Uncharacterized protein OS=Desulfosporosinus sp. OT GN=DOT_0185 PE=4 SV=1 [Gemmata massiliana]|uniref:Uncharacterized protein n=1 Tax=Gemmata massiliana TaxID=1210884 RepID=A0A6P2CW04_9BACT|nr:Uncharacterized protein OS=Desulfosporosinus sp. OT GN=DOT_0185 PE=4 SV=1 [Gemmata massiliana]